MDKLLEFSSDSEEDMDAVEVPAFNVNQFFNDNVDTLSTEPVNMNNSDTINLPPKPVTNNYTDISDLLNEPFLNNIHPTSTVSSEPVTNSCRDISALLTDQFFSNDQVNTTNFSPEPVINNHQVNTETLCNNDNTKQELLLTSLSGIYIKRMKPTSVTIPVNEKTVTINMEKAVIIPPTKVNSEIDQRIGTSENNLIERHSSGKILKYDLNKAAPISPEFIKSISSPIGELRTRPIKRMVSNNHNASTSTSSGRNQTYNLKNSRTHSKSNASSCAANDPIAARFLVFPGGVVEVENQYRNSLESTSISTPEYIPDEGEIVPIQYRSITQQMIPQAIPQRNVTTSNCSFPNLRNWPIIRNGSQAPSRRVYVRNQPHLNGRFLSGVAPRTVLRRVPDTGSVHYEIGENGPIRVVTLSESEIRKGSERHRRMQNQYNRMPIPVNSGFRRGNGRIVRPQLVRRVSCGLETVSTQQIISQVARTINDTARAENQNNLASQLAQQNGQNGNYAASIMLIPNGVPVLENNYGTIAGNFESPSTSNSQLAQDEGEVFTNPPIFQQQILSQPTPQINDLATFFSTLIKNSLVESLNYPFGK